MDFLYAYQNNGYQENRVKDLSSDEKAYLRGKTDLASKIKLAYDNYCYDELNEKSKFDELKKESITEFMKYLELWISSDWAESEIGFTDEGSEESPRKPNPEYVWNNEEYEVDEPDDWFEEGE